MSVMKDESFGPVLGIMKVDSDEQAIGLINDSEFGLTAAVFTKNIEQIKKFKKKYKKIVIKPIHGYGGKNILFVNKLINQTKVLNYIKKFGQYF